MSFSRRNFIKSTVSGAAGTALAGGVLAGGAQADAATTTGEPAATASYPYYGAHQAGVLTPAPGVKQAFTMVAAFDCTAKGKPALASLLRALTARCRFLTTGGTPPKVGAGQAPADSDVLGPVVPADGLTVTVSVGASLFDDRYGLAASKPKKLTTMPAFPNDALESAWLHGDLLLQLCANHPDTLHHAIRDIAKHTRGGMRLHWKMEGYNSPPRPSGTPRNLLGFKDGTANPVGTLANSLVWVDELAEPAWAQGGSYQVVRLIRMLLESWDQGTVDQQQQTVGRRRDSGAPLDGTTEFQVPDYASDPHGNVTPLNAHIRLANPRTAATANQRLVRRSYNYDLGADANGDLQAGHIFIAYQQDIQRQFETVQHRLINEPLASYVQPFGGGYFFVLPGVRSDTDWYASRLLG